MRKRAAVCFVVFFGSLFGLAECAGGEGQEVETLEERVEELEEEVAELQLVVGLKSKEEPQHEQAQPQKTQQEKTQ